MIIKKNQKLFFWIALSVFLLLAFGQIATTSANTDSGDLIINEFVAANGSGLIDEDGDHSDWIEIYNRGHQPVNLAGWSLTNDSNQPLKWTFPDTTLGSNEYLVVFASGKNRNGVEAGTALHTNFKLNKAGDFLALHNVLEGRFMDVISPRFPEQSRDVSYGRYGDEQTHGYLIRPTPGQPNDETFVQAGAVAPVNFSIERGFYDAPFGVVLTTDTPDATIRYTTDGSEPTETNGTIYAGPVTIETTTLLRAAAFRPTFRSSFVDTHSYIFLDQVLSQPANPSGFPASWGARLTDVQGHARVAPVVADYEMDPELVNDAPTRDTLTEDLKSLPTLSLVMDAPNFADLNTYPGNRGKSSERPVSVELIYPDDDTPGFQINAGVRPQGGLEGTDFSPKQSLRLFFRGKYGPTKLEYPIFPDSSMEEFDTLVLSSSLAGPGSGGEQATYTRNEWLRSSQIAMSGLGAHGTYVHLYLNGLYWGLYNIAERPDASFMSSYLGGDETDWFVADQDGPLSSNLDGQAGTLNSLFTTLGLGAYIDGELEQSEFLSDSYAALATYIDPAQFSDFIILNWYAQSQDWPEHNWYAVIRLEDLGGRGKFLIGDELPISNNENTQTSFDQTNSARLNSVALLFETLMQNPEFKIQFADRMYQHLFNDGALTDASAQARWRRLNMIIDPAIAGESARWGDATQESPLTRADWLQAGNRTLAQMEGKAAALISQARDAGYYPPVDPPLFSQDGGLVEVGFNLAMTLPPASSEGTIYYTTDGSDPRMAFTGAVAPSAVAHNGPVVLTTDTRVKARLLVGDPSASAVAELTWSALHEATFSVVEQDYKLRITEIMYNPADGDDYEFIELQNMGHSELNLAGMAIDEGIRFTFPPDAPPLAAGEVATLVSNPAAFAERYPGVAVSGVYEGHLSNKGEKLILTDAAGQRLVEVTYNDENGWPLSADGRGDSLVLIDETGSLSNPKNWRASTDLNGSPGVDQLIMAEANHDGESGTKCVEALIESVGQKC